LKAWRKAHGLKTRKTNRLKSSKRFEEMKDFSTSRQGKLWGEREREIDLRAVVRCYPKVGNQRLPGSCGQILLINLLSHSPVPSYTMTSVFQVKSTEGERSSQNGTEIPSLVEVCINSRAFLLLLLLVDVFQFLDSYTKKLPM
jgi:hypothetical protein